MIIDDQSHKAGYQVTMLTLLFLYPATTVLFCLSKHIKICNQIKTTHTLLCFVFQSCPATKEEKKAKMFSAQVFWTSLQKEFKQQTTKAGYTTSLGRAPQGVLKGLSPCMCIFCPLCLSFMYQ